MTDKLYKQIFTILRMALNGETAETEFGADLDAVFDEMNRQTLTSLTANVLKKLPLGAESYAKWHQRTLQLVVSGINIQKEEEKLAALLTKHGIGAVVLKGSCCASFYPDNVYRTFGDVDILVKPDDYEKAASVMTECGYRRLGELYGDPRNIEFSMNRTKFELHRCFFTGKHEDMNEVLYSAIDMRVMRKAYSVCVPTLPDAETGLMLLEHMRMHLKSSELGMRQMVDWYVYARKVCTDDFWTREIKPLTDKAGLTELAKTAAKLADMYLGMPDGTRWFKDVPDENCESLLNALVKSGNFGNKRSARENAIELMARKMSFGQWMRYLQRTGLGHWTAAQKHSILRPFAWMYQIARYIKRSVGTGTLLTLITRNGWKEIRHRQTLYKLTGE